MKKKLLAMILIVAVVATLLTGCTLFPVDEERDYHQVVATVDYKDMSKDVLKGDLLNYYVQYGGTYIYYYGWTEAETLEYLCTSLARQNLLLLYAKEYLATQADPDITDAEIAAMKAEDFLTVDERRYCIEQTNKSFEESWRSLITELEEEQAANEGTTDEEEPEEDETTEELEARPVRPEEEESDEYVDEGMTDAAQLPKGFMDTVQSEIDAETDATARKNMSTALKEFQDNLASGFKDYAYYLNSQYETRILDKYREALGDALPEITDEELNARYNRLVSLDISKYTDEEAYASALESTSDIYYHTTQGYSQVRSILLKFTDEQTDALKTITNMVGDNEDAVKAYRAILALGEDVAGKKMPSQFASLADLGIKVNVSNPDYDEEEDELADAYTDKGVDYKVILYAMADYIAAKVDAAAAAATAAEISGNDLELVKQYAASEAITDWIYLVNDDTGMFDSESYVLSPSGSASSYVEEYTVLGRALAEQQGIGSYAIPADSFTDGAAALAYTAAEGKEPTAILNAVNGKTYDIASDVVYSKDENREELSTTVYTLKTEAGNTISFIVNDFGIHVIYVADKFLDASKGDWSEYKVDDEVKGYKLGIGYLHSYEVEFEYAEDEEGNATDTITGVTLTKTTIGEYIKETIKDERSSAEFSDKQTEIFLDTSKNIIVQQGVYDGLLKDITG